MNFVDFVKNILVAMGTIVVTCCGVIMKEEGTAEAYNRLFLGSNPRDLDEVFERCGAQFKDCEKVDIVAAPVRLIRDNPIDKEAWNAFFVLVSLIDGEYKNYAFVISREMGGATDFVAGAPKPIRDRARIAAEWIEDVAASYE